MPNRSAGLAAGLVLALGLIGCGDGGVRAQVDGVLNRLDQSLARLGNALDGDDLRNAKLIKRYAAEVGAAKPDIEDLAAVLALEATRRGTLFQGLESRLQDVRGRLPEAGAPAAAYADVAEELDSLSGALAIDEFNDALADPLNVLADLSDGQLPRVDAAPASATRRANAATNFGPGSQLVGNPSYGRWQTDSGGSSFWVWYGQYALIRDLLGGPRIGYGAWAGGRDYSYYHDYGRRNYTSPSARRSQSQVESTARRKFSSEGRTFRSPYARSRQGASTSLARRKFASRASQRAGVSSRTRAASSRPASFRGFGGGRGPRRGK